MPPSTPDNVETKAVIHAEKIPKLLLRSLEGRVLPLSDRRDEISAILKEPDSLQEHTFARGPEGVQQKQEFSRQGGVIVQNGIIMVNNTIKNLLVVHDRLEASASNPGHRVVTGSSILLSGDARKDPIDIMTQKLEFDAPHQLALAIDAPETDLIGVGVSRAKEIYYLFLLYRAMILDGITLSPKDTNKDQLAFRGRNIARQRIGKKPLEHSILDQWNKF